jgi:hypothetical protein
VQAAQNQQQGRRNQAGEGSAPKAEPRGAGIRQSRFGDGPSATKEQNGKKEKMQR